MKPMVFDEQELRQRLEATAPAAVRLRLSFTVAVNGQSRPRPKNAPPPVFTLPPGKLRIRVGVIVQARAKVTNLWLGVAKGALGSPGPHGQRPPGLRPILAHAPGPLTPGLHTFRLTWTMPAHLPRGASLSLLRGVQVADADQDRAQAIIPGLAVELREVQLLGSHTYSTHNPRPRPTRRACGDRLCRCGQ
jgi:hypothetical protein